MPTNQFFNHFSYGNEQALVEDLILESIKQYGHSVYYLPRDIVKRDNLYGEDSLSRFTKAAEVEMYIKNVEGFAGEGTLFSKFQYEINDQITFTVSRRRFDQIRSEKLTTETGYNFRLESANTSAPMRQFLTSTQETDSFELETATGDGYTITSERPLEGDIIYFPMVNKMFEIKFVEHEAFFYQTGRLQSYDLVCELFTYSSERFDTGNSAFDVIEDTYSADALVYEFTLEDDNGVLQTETGHSILQEFSLNVTDKQANNTLFAAETRANNVINFDETDPWSESKWP